MPMSIRNVIEQIDWKLLREQKEYCINEANNNHEVGHIYDGLVNLIDAIQDAAINDGLATETQVFGEFEDD